MALDIAPAQGALTGERYIESLKDDREVWLHDVRVDVTTHAAFAGMLHELARLYDLQHTPEYRDSMTCVSPDTGNRVSYSYLLPRTMDDLLAKRRNCEIWMVESWGQLPRAPDFMSNVAVGLYDFREHLRGNNPRFGDNAVRYHRYCQEPDIVLTHGLGDPQVDRSSSPAQDPDMALCVLREASDGIVIRGATLLAEAIGVDSFREVRDKLGELISYAEIVRLGLRGMEAEAQLTDGGLLAPGDSAGFSIFAAQISPRLVEIIRDLGACGLIMQPSEADLANPELRPYLDQYMRSHDIGAAEKARLFRLAWDLAGDSSGSCQELYERWHRGDLVRNRNNLYLRYDHSRIVERIRQLISKPLSPYGIAG